MERVFPNCAGLDIHKKLIVACRLTTDERGQTQKAVRKFGTLTAELEALAAWLAAGGCTHVAMESTGVYWRPIYNILQEHVEVWVVNAHHVKHVPGRKTDVKDAEWLAQLLQQGLLRPSFIPSREQRELRDVVRQRQALVEDRTRVVNRLQKVLEDANLKLASVVGDLQGVSAQAILRALLGGEEEPRALADLARGRLRKKRADLERALVGRLREHHRFMLLHLLAQLDFLDEEITLLDAHIDALITGQPEVAAAVERLDSIPGGEPADRHRAGRGDRGRRQPLPHRPSSGGVGGPGTGEPRDGGHAPGCRHAQGQPLPAAVPGAGGAGGGAHERQLPQGPLPPSRGPAREASRGGGGGPQPAGDRLLPAAPRGMVPRTGGRVLRPAGPRAHQRAARAAPATPRLRRHADRTGACPGRCHGQSLIFGLFEVLCARGRGDGNPQGRRCQQMRLRQPRNVPGDRQVLRGRERHKHTKPQRAASNSSATSAAASRTC